MIRGVPRHGQAGKSRPDWTWWEHELHVEGTQTRLLPVTITLAAISPKQLVSDYAFRGIEIFKFSRFLTQEDYQDAHMAIQIIVVGKEPTANEVRQIPSGKFAHLVFPSN